MNNIRARRRILGLTMKQLANIVGVTEAAISHYETGRREPDNDMLLRIANALGVTVDYLIGRENQLSPAQEKAPSTSSDDIIMSRAREMNVEELHELLAKLIEITKEKGKQ